ncbi:hypothetical protein [Paraclostridium bifermentans]|uniref:hypothetical protein n=1 Tax=Paraclostridium bifermentans TaxID=1490 RepID=UPI00374FBE8C
MKKILFLENEKYYKDLGVLRELNKKYCLEFNGMKKYKIESEEIKSYDCIISTLYTNPICNYIILKAKENRVKTILISDGIIEWANLFINPMQKKYNLKLYHPILHDIFLCLGDDECEYFNKYNKKVIKFMPSRIINNLKKIETPNLTRVLITTSNTAYFSELERDILVDILKKVVNSLEELNVDYIFRIYDEYLINSLNINEYKNKIEPSFEEVLKDVGVVITTPSSISLNAMYHDRAVAHILYRDTPMFLQSGWVISNSYPVKDTIKSLISKDEHRMNFQKYQVEKYLNENLEKNKLEQAIECDYELDMSESYIKFINQNLYNTVNSRFNINIEFTVRQVYLKLKQNKKINKFLKKIRNRMT